jgi:hypothetical protein
MSANTSGEENRCHIAREKRIEAIVQKEWSVTAELILTQPILHDTLPEGQKLARRSQSVAETCQKVSLARRSREPLAARGSGKFLNPEGM